MPDFFATVRTNPINGAIDVLGVVGSKYEPVQNEDSCDLLDALVDESGAHFETAGALRGGRETFVTMKLPNAMDFDGRDGTTDRTEFYLAALNSHDGSSAFRFLVTPVRIVCANTQSAAIGSAKASFAIRHTGGARASISEARTALKLSWRYIEAFEAEAAALYAQPMDTEQMRHFAHTLLEVDSAGSEATARHRRERAHGIVTLWTSSPTITPIAGTRWAAYNAVTEYLDHVVPVRGARTSTDASAARALRGITRQHRIAESPSVPAAADPLTAPHRARSASHARVAGRAPFSSVSMALRAIGRQRPSSVAPHLLAVSGRPV